MGIFWWKEEISWIRYFYLVDLLFLFYFISDLKPRSKHNFRGHAASLWLSLVPQLENSGSYDSLMGHGILSGPTWGIVRNMTSHYIQFCKIINNQRVPFVTETQFYYRTVPCIWYFLWILCIMHKMHIVWYAVCIICTRHISLCIIHWNIIFPVTFKAFYTLWNSLGRTNRQTNQQTNRQTLSGIELLSQLKIECSASKKPWKYINITLKLH
jgi:hypothetical protein